LAKSRSPCMRLASASRSSRSGTASVDERMPGEGDCALTTIVVGAPGDGSRVEHAGTGAAWIQVLVEDGRVTLTGRVSSIAHKRIAELIAWWTNGVAAVDNQLSVSPPEEDNDYEIAEAVQIAFEKDPLVHSAQIHP